MLQQAGADLHVLVIRDEIMQSSLNFTIGPLLKVQETVISGCTGLGVFSTTLINRGDFVLDYVSGSNHISAQQKVWK